MNSEDKLDFLKELTDRQNEELAEENFIGIITPEEPYQKMKDHFSKISTKWYSCGEYDLFPWPPTFDNIVVFKNRVQICALMKKDGLFTFDFPISLRGCYFDNEESALSFLSEYYKALIRKPK